MSDLVGNPEDWFSGVAAQGIHVHDTFPSTAPCCGSKIVSISSDLCITFFCIKNPLSKILWYMYGPLESKLQVLFAEAD